MRLLVGIIIGAGLVIGGAYVHDSNLSGPLQARDQLVNWEAAGRLSANAYDGIRAQIDQLFGR